MSSLRKLLILVPVLFVFVFMGVSMVPQASVAAASQDIVLADSQHLAVAADIPVTVPERDSYSVTVYDIVQWPVPVNTPIGSDFGPRIPPIAGASSFHKGDDFDAGYGYGIQSIANGVVTKAGEDGSLGWEVEITSTINGTNVVSVYGHMQAGSLRVSEGQTIKRGTVVGLLGSTGLSTGAHLHFEVHVNGTPVNPLPWLQANANVQDWPGA